MKDHNAIVLRNKRLSGPLYLMRLRANDLASSVQPGQFVHMSIPTLQANILRRPFSVYDADVEEGTIDILYQVVGTGTENMSQWLPGYLTDMIGPIGKSWHAPKGCHRALLVGGGVGAAPLFMLCRKLIADGVDVDVVLGATTKDSLVCKERYDETGLQSIMCTTDDGTFGVKGFATVELARAIEESSSSDTPYEYAAICGPEPLMRAASEMTLRAGIPTQLSMEKRMACGVGACLSCVVETRSGRKRACVDGPIFDASEVIWQ